MKKLLRSLVRNESGQGVLIIVLVLLVLGASLIVPLLNLMGTGLLAGRVHEERTEEFYAADAGVEDAVYKIRINALPTWMQGNWNESVYSHEPYTYSIGPQINGKNTTVAIQPIWVLEGLETPKPEQRREPHDDLVTVGDVIASGEYQIKLIRSEDFPGELKVERIGCWLPAGFEYVAGSSNLEENQTKAYYCVPRTFPYGGGTAIVWEVWLRQPDSTKIWYDNLTGPSTNEKVVTFEFTPIDEPLQGSFSWARTNRNDLYLSWDVDCKLYKITATATDPLTNKFSTVTAYTSKNEFRKFGQAVSGDYQATGNTLMRDADSDSYDRRERLYKETDATISTIPNNATVEKIFLYWSGWENSPWDVWGMTEEQLQALPANSKVNEVQLKVEVPGFPAIVLSEKVTASLSQVLPNGNPDDPHGWSYSCSADITDLVKDFFASNNVSFVGNAEYTVGHALLGAVSTTNSLNSVWGSSASDIFVVGDSGTIFHYNGTSWSAMTSGSTSDLYGVWGSSSSNVFAVGASGTILHYNGTSWSAMTSGTTYTLRGVWGDASYVYAVGSSGTIRRCPNGGTSWSAMTSGTSSTLYGVWGDASYVYVVGSSGTIRRCPNGGTSWSAMTSGTSNTLYGVWGDASYIYVVGSSGTIRRCPNGGTSWSAMTSGTSNTLRGVWGDASWVYVVGSSGTIRRCPNGGTSWTAMSSGTSNTLYDVWGSSSSDVYAVGDSGTMLHYDGSAWSLMVGRELYQWKESHSGETIIDWTNYPLGSPRDPDGYQDEWSYAGWSAVVIYTSPQTKGHQLYIYDTFRYCDNAQTLNFTIKNFLAPQDVLYDPAAARMTCFVGEGDVIYGAGQYDYECLAEYGVHDWDCLILNDYYLSDATNPWNNVWNSKSNIMAGRFIDGIDIDTFNATYPIIEPGDNTAEVSMPTGLDSWNLVYIVLSFRSETTTGGLLSYEIEVG